MAFIAPDRCLPCPRELLLNMLTELDNLLPRLEEMQEENKMKHLFWNMDDFYKRFPSSDVSLNSLQCANAVPVQENTMCDLEDMDSDSMTEAERTREYFQNELNISRSIVIRKANQHYGLEDDEMPRTFEDFIDRIKTGKYVVNPRYANDTMKNKFSHYDVGCWIKWRDPTKIQDEAGFEEASEILSKFYRKASHRIRVEDIKELPKIVEEFENTKFH